MPGREFVLQPGNSVLKVNILLRFHLVFGPVSHYLYFGLSCSIHIYKLISIFIFIVGHSIWRSFYLKHPNLMCVTRNISRFLATCSMKRIFPIPS